MTHCCIQHLLSHRTASQSPLSLQSVSKVTGFSTVHCTRPCSPASFAYRLMAMLPSALAVLNLINTAPLAGCTLSLGKKKKRNLVFFFLFFLMCVFSGAALGLPMKSDFSMYLCIFGVVRGCSFAWFNLYHFAQLCSWCFCAILVLFGFSSVAGALGSNPTVPACVLPGRCRVLFRVPSRACCVCCVAAGRLFVAWELLHPALEHSSEFSAPAAASLHLGLLSAAPWERCSRNEGRVELGKTQRMLFSG